MVTNTELVKRKTDLNKTYAGLNVEHYDDLGGDGQK